MDKRKIWVGYLSGEEAHCYDAAQIFSCVQSVALFRRSLKAVE